MVSLMVSVKPGIREEKGAVRITGSKIAPGAARSMLVASEVNAKKLSGAPLLRAPWRALRVLIVGASQGGSSNYPAWSTFLDLRRHCYSLTSCFHRPQLWPGTPSQGRWGSLEELLDTTGTSNWASSLSLPSQAASLCVCVSFLNPSNKKKSKPPLEIISDKCLWSNGFQTVFLEALGFHLMSEESIHLGGATEGGDFWAFHSPLQPTQIQFDSFYLRFYVFVCLKNIKRFKSCKMVCLCQ